MSDLGPFWLSLRVAALATFADRRGRRAAGAGCWRGSSFPGKALVAGLLVLPLVLPPTVVGFYLLQLLGRRSMLGHWLEQTLGITLVFHWSGAVVASAVAAFPLFLLPARGAFEAIDPGLEDVARLLGRSELSVFWSVTLPLAWRGLAAGIVLAFARALGDFGATLMVAGNIPGLTQTAALAIYDAVQVNDTHRAGWLTLLDLARVDRGARARPADLARARAIAVSGPSPANLTARVVRQVHDSLTLDVSLELGAEAGIVFGPSGAGKTTLLRLIAGLTRPQAGRVSLGRNDTVRL